MLWEQGYLLQNFSYIRLMWNIGRGDEHFLVLEEGLLQGLEAGIHSGREGIHKPEKILRKKNPCWEAQHLAREPIARPPRRK
jgi:hypothetical protein